ncbi:hypothetical protein AVEN_266797-1 [Araneus ventricosus]|uniref:Uncharacterized protein n=1 Tax=Araneus ventricosus TaxID=182803 RepID=A0A4Y2R4F8_ARAVE|nr:hypothetical protein AVEN_266797-1 [Araneus ventricosus]
MCLVCHSITICPVFWNRKKEKYYCIFTSKKYDIGNTEILFNQFVYLKDYLVENNTNQNCEATMKLNMEDKRPFADTKYIESEVLSNEAMQIRICHSTPQCKCGENIFPNVNSMVGRTKQVVSGDD